MSKLSGRIIEKRYLEVSGLIGTFDLPKKKVIVKYFSTIASNRNKNSHSYDLLKELKPMRERVKASALKDLGSLLQRNLDDFRVAKELIPYLIGENPVIAFFPSILGVLIPKGFLSEEKETEYPTPRTDKTPDGNTCLSYSDKWKLEIFNINGQESNLGILSIDIADVDIVVLDGQHRANAFRVACGAFSDKDSSVYPAFYSDIEKQPKFDADLPITLIWFENEDETAMIDPRFVSRRLFVDVNNSAKRVSKSRTILLDEYEVPSLLTRFFYSSVAKEKSFSLDGFSLFHSEFDKESDIKTSGVNALSITNPEILYDVLSWLVLGSRNYNVLNCYKVSREHFKNNATAFGEIFDEKKFNSRDINPFDEYLNAKRVIIKDSEKIPSFQDEYENNLHKVIYGVYNQFTLFQQHYKATYDLGNCYSGWHTTWRTVWDDVFCGGEGLYYTFRNKDIKDKQTKPLKDYLTAIEEIEKEFKTLRAKYFSGANEKDVDKAFESVKSKAFQVGLFMALDVFRDGEKYINRYEDFIVRLNSIQLENWIYILNSIKKELIPSGVDPKLWPSYQKLILRIIQNDNRPYFHKNNFLESPDGQIFRGKIEKKFDSWYSSNEDYDDEQISIEVIGNTEINKWGNNAKLYVDELLNKAQIELIRDVEVENLAVQIVQEKIDGSRPYPPKSK